MSNSSLIRWFEQLLFGSKDTCLLEPPKEASFTIAKLRAERIEWREMARLGGLTMYRYQIQCDFDALFDYLENPDNPLPTMKTRAVSTFFNILLANLARRDAVDDSPDPSVDDKTTLEQMMVDPSSKEQYVSASFWGQLARQWLNNRRPVPTDLQSLASNNSSVDRITRLYDVTCYARGEWIDPLSMHLVPKAEYVNAIHWKSESHLEAFIRTKPKHPLSKSINQLILKSLHQFLAGQYP
ncbi:hypothetical protein JTE90_016316 [Oedothorax gibbosus]|uniref:Uncharacterized protein n=1 Tax=Oedothorax gibbosus TaxID=931172 RepID=A0AAV6TPS3_9ARAC|nr:hypothetical protein JTE90_016316 [Oedothorax gibbosus]